MRQYVIRFTVSDELMPVVIALVSDRVEELTVEQVRGELTAPGTPQKKARLTTGERPAHRTMMGALLLRRMRTGRLTLSDLTEDVCAAGFSPSSASPGLSRLVRDGYARYVERGVYALTDKGTATGEEDQS
jgi:hypothetical protein